MLVAGIEEAETDVARPGTIHAGHGDLNHHLLDAADAREVDDGDGKTFSAVVTDLESGRIVDEMALDEEPEAMVLS